MGLPEVCPRAVPCWRVPSPPRLAHCTSPHRSVPELPQVPEPQEGYPKLAASQQIATPLSHSLRPGLSLDTTFQTRVGAFRTWSKAPKRNSKEWDAQERELLGLCGLGGQGHCSRGSSTAHRGRRPARQYRRRRRALPCLIPEGGDRHGFCSHRHCGNLLSSLATPGAGRTQKAGYAPSAPTQFPQTHSCLGEGGFAPAELAASHSVLTRVSPLQSLSPQPLGLCPVPSVALFPDMVTYLSPSSRLVLYFPRIQNTNTRLAASLTGACQTRKLISV